MTSHSLPTEDLFSDSFFKMEYCSESASYCSFILFMNFPRISARGQAGIYKFDKERMEQNEGRALAASTFEDNSFRAPERHMHAANAVDWQLLKH